MQVLESFWKINVTDIESTLKQVVTHVLSEPGVTERELNARAKALKKLGSIFQVQALSAQVNFPWDAEYCTSWFPTEICIFTEVRRLMR